MPQKQSGHENSIWENYYKHLEGRTPRPLFLAALAQFEQERVNDSQLHAIDLGCGDGTETLVLLSAGWKVLAIDNVPTAIEILQSNAAPDHHSRLEVRIASFEHLDFPATDFIYAGYSLPFCRPEYFDHVWKNITTCIRPGGRFAGQFFGIRDSWADNPAMTFHSTDQVHQILEGTFEIETLQETEEDGQAFSGPKHWHVFNVIGRRLDI
jgi:SAM-dependent methyltransferase